MSECYHFENIQFDDGLLNDCVDATYIIHLKENGRLENIKTQLKIYKPTDNIHILINKGPTCEKNIENHIPPTDLVHAFLQCFQHAEGNAYNNILILEDDFMFSEKIKEREHSKNICGFIKNKEGELLSYRIGCIPLLQIPCTTDFMHYRGFFMGTHAVIYNKLYRVNLLKTDISQIHDWDIFNNLNANSYTYYLPLCYQLFPETENLKYWGIKNNLYLIAGKILFFIFQLLGLNTSVEPGYSFFYIFSKTIFFLLAFLLIWLSFLFIFARTSIKYLKTMKK